MMTNLLDNLSQYQQPLLEMFAQVTCWALLGMILLFIFRRKIHTSRALLVYICLGTLVLSASSLVPFRLWSVNFTWPKAPAAPNGKMIILGTETNLLAPSNDSNLPKRVEQSNLSSWNTFYADWPYWLLMAMFLLSILAALALLRLMLGLIAIQHCLKKSIPIDNYCLQQQVEELRQALNLKQPIQLRLVTNVQSPATIGWRHPTILLPVSWTQWDEAECRAVLAHELAHVRNHDYPLWLLAQFARALHIYHPLVRWLMHRLQAHLELAADTLAAPLAGGPLVYMRSLCRLALRHGRPGILAPALLPVHLPLSWRIMMLRSNSFLAETPNRWKQTLFGCTFALAALTLAGLRGNVAADDKKDAVQSKPVPTPMAQIAPIPAAGFLVPAGSKGPLFEIDLQVMNVRREVVENYSKIRKNKDVKMISEEPSSFSFVGNEALEFVKFVKSDASSSLLASPGFAILNDHAACFVTGPNSISFKPTLLPDEKKIQLHLNHALDAVVYVEKPSYKIIQQTDITTSLDEGQTFCSGTDIMKDSQHPKGEKMSVIIVTVKSIPAPTLPGESKQENKETKKQP